jgi:hypothetical protein
MKNGKFVEAGLYEITSLSFVLGYFHHYRYIRSQILEKDVDTVYTAFPNFRPEQIESIAIMLRVELMVNAVMYCSDLAAILLAFAKPVDQILKTVSSLHETGSGSIKEFYQEISSQPPEYFWKLLGYDKLEMASDKARYERSCARFQDDISHLSKFFLKWYQLHSCYKHGLNIVAFVESKTGSDVLIMGNPDGTFDTVLLPPSWYLAYIETIEIVFKMFSRVVEPRIWKLVIGTMKIDLKDKTMKKVFVSKEPEDKTRPHKFSFTMSYPWKIWDVKDHEPFY